MIIKEQVIKIADPKFAVIILAGGLSSRMKQFKPLLPLGNTSVIEHVISTFRKAGTDIYLVVGYRRDELKAALKYLDIHFVDNPEYEKGMYSSVLAGVRGLGDGYQAFFIQPADIPMVSSSTVETLKNVGISHQESIIYPVYHGKRGHPPLIPANLRKGILAWKQEGGLKSFLQLYKDKAIEVLVEDPYILFDIDSPEDYKKLLIYYRQN